MSTHQGHTDTSLRREAGERRPRMPISEPQVVEALSVHYALTADVQQLPSFVDLNFLAEESGTTRQFAVKLFSDAPRDLSPKFEVEVLDSIDSEWFPSFRVPRLRKTMDGQQTAKIAAGNETLEMRVVSFVPGDPVASRRVTTQEDFHRLGMIAGDLASHLASLETLTAYSGGWDLRRALEVIRSRDNLLLAPHRRDMVLRLLARVSDLEPILRGLRTSAIHGDLTLENILIAGPSGEDAEYGVIDFGDATYSWTVAEVVCLAVSAASHEPSLETLGSIVGGFNARLPLMEIEIDHLTELMCLRACAVALETEYAHASQPDNRYVQAALDREWTSFEFLMDTSPAVRETVAEACGLPRSNLSRQVLARLAELPAPVALIQGLDAATPVWDIAVGSSGLRRGEWRNTQSLARLLRDLAGDRVAVTRHGVGRLGRYPTNDCPDPATVHLGVDVFAPEGTVVRAPHDAQVKVLQDGRMSVELSGAVLMLDGFRPAGHLTAGDQVSRGQELGSLTGSECHPELPAHAHVQLCVDVHVPAVPPWSTETDSPRWLSACPDPSPLLGLAPASQKGGLLEPTEAELLVRRRRALASPQHYFYRRPPEMVRGWQSWMFSRGGRPYLDLVNNVAILGHSHPAVTDAVTRQLELINTNSRFLYEQNIEFAEGLIRLLPASLNRVFFVSTGSEANDLALRMARHATGATRTLVHRGVYHGWTTATAEISTLVLHNPEQSTGEHVTAVPLPGEAHAADDRHPAGILELQSSLGALEAAGERIAAFICESVPGTAGGSPYPDGYLNEAYELIRAAGGLCIADEVQVGYGRLGEYFWGFDQQGVEPDIVTIGKCTGNGYPIAAVITSKEIADEFGSPGPWFSSVGGSPVACAAGLAVLDVVRDEGLQTNARKVGGHLEAALSRLAAEFPICGEVSGMGLYRGLQITALAEGGETSVALAERICEAMRERSVITQPTGLRDDYLKFKPPLVIEASEVDFAVDALRLVLERASEPQRTVTSRG